MLHVIRLRYIHIKIWKFVHTIDINIDVVCFSVYIETFDKGIKHAKYKTYTIFKRLLRFSIMISVYIK